MSDSLTRRAMLASTSGALATTVCKPALGQGLRPVRFTLSWLAQGTSAFLYAGREKGFFKARGLDLQISRGFGSLAAAQAIGAGQFDVGIVVGAPLILMVAKGLPLKAIATIDYDAMMGVGVLDDGRIKTPKDLVGHTVATVPASAESPFFPAYEQRVGVDPKGVNVVGVDPKILERLLATKEVDAITGVASSCLPVLLSRKAAVRWFLYSSAGIPTAGNTLVTTQATAADDGLCSALAEAVMESIYFTITSPEEAASLFFKAVPEAALNADGKSFIDIGMGLHRCAIAGAAAKANGLGWGDLKVYEAVTDLVMDYTAGPDSKRPDIGSWYTNKYVGKLKPTEAQWDAVAASAEPYARYLT